ncbi:MAG: penicillin-binding transpeptidase domain-containing protein [Desulforegulaceae bacterium]|nr:penicillin-binding transpeptidase domain-containing protein [Desulforegulaceae bacterium]
MYDYIDKGKRNRFDKKKTKKTNLKKIFKFVFLMVFLFLSIFSIFKLSSKKVDSPVFEPKLISKTEIREILTDIPESEFTKKYFVSKLKNETIVFHTSINENLQNYLEMEIQAALNCGHGAPKIICFAIADAYSGKVLGLKGYNFETSENISPCTKTLYPAASLFKIISSAAVIETKNYTPNQKMAFNGGKYTLYKKQLSNSTTKYTNYIKLKDAFAQSVNPVFGKIGFFELKKDNLIKFSSDFLLNKEADTEIPLTTGVVNISDKKYNWAEIASGYNNSTKISVLHSAFLSMPITNKGFFINPLLVEKIIDDGQNTRYENISSIKEKIINESTSKKLAEMMERTVKAGTAKNSFNAYRNGKTMKNIIIGGKTGSISDYSKEVKYDWFSGYAIDNDSQKAIVFSVLIGHGQFIGTKSSEFARKLIANYFSHLF